jgi:integrase
MNGAYGRPLARMCEYSGRAYTVYETTEETPPDPAQVDARLLQLEATVWVKKFKENNERVRYLTDEEEGRLFKALPLEHHVLVVTDLHTGLRQGELFNLRWTDIDFYSDTINVRQSKSGEGRRIPMNKALREALLTLRQARHRQGQKAQNGQELYSPFIFCSPNGAFLRNFARTWYPTLEAAKIEDFHFHDLRHTFASRLVMAGVDLYTVKTLLGHRTIQMTMRYAHLAPGHLKRAVEVLDKRTPVSTGEATVPGGRD